MVTSPSRHVFRALCGIVLLSCCFGCQPPPPPTGESWLPQLADGEFLQPGTRIDFRQRFAEAETLPVILPPLYLARVESSWGGTESWGAWGVGRSTTFSFFLRWQPFDRLYLVSRAAADPRGRKQNVKVVVNGQGIGRLDIGLDWEEHLLDLPAGLLQPGANRVELVYGFHLEGEPGVDPRQLALAIETIGLLAPGQDPQQFTSTAPKASVEIDTDNDALRFSGSGTYLAPIRIPNDAEALELSIDLDGRGTRFRAAVMATDGSEKGLLDDIQGGRRHRLPLQGYRGREVFLIFDADLADGGSVSLNHPRLVQASATPLVASPGDRSSVRPNIVMVVLDAARADRFGSYGYARDTTPLIDSIAAESLVFETAIAECPYTVCSMPQLLAGLSFLQHGLVARTHKLADETQTLAEVLSQLGYQTLAFTGNPNSSRATGSDQGFDEFHEIWRRATGRDRTHPGFLTDLVIERLGQVDDRPLFLMLHYVPPHEPYDPDPEFDLFGDPTYNGQVTGDQAFVQAAFTQQVDLVGADLAELSALYDGNLRMADHHVGRVVTALQAAGRWDDTLFILTSDHGEAFAEHGVLGHNQTLYEEMLRVPLILRFPQGQHPATVEPTRLASLGDVMPTILGYLDHPTPVGASGSNLLASRQDKDRRIHLRTSHQDNTIFGLRTQRWKLMSRGPKSWDPGWFRLFDLEADPAETVNLAAKRRLLQTTLAIRLVRALRTQQPTQTESGEISGADEEMLKSLGYL